MSIPLSADVLQTALKTLNLGLGLSQLFCSGFHLTGGLSGSFLGVIQFGQSISFSGLGGGEVPVVLGSASHICHPLAFSLPLQMPDGLPQSLTLFTLPSRAWHLVGPLGSREAARACFSRRWVSGAPPTTGEELAAAVDAPWSVSILMLGVEAGVVRRSPAYMS
jgi:hypothetical protein